ncbi:hypothetical protein CW368_05285 [Actinomycetales bacterium SN12]|nr:hypothetical protein CW368_05285 [Actinomycetales bacterium SN12]
MGEISPAAGSQRPRLRATIITVAVVVAAVLIVVGLAAAQGRATAEPTAPPGPHTLELIEETLPPGLGFLGSDDAEALGGATDGDVMRWQTALQSAFHGDPNFGSPWISQDGTLFTIVWYGEPTDALRAHVSEAPSGLDVVIHSADFPPGELQELVARAMKPGLVPGVQLVLGAVENDASGIRLGLAEEPEKTLEEIGAAIADALGRPDVPVRVEVSGAVIPIGG